MRKSSCLILGGLVASLSLLLAPPAHSQPGYCGSPGEPVKPPEVTDVGRGGPAIQASSVPECQPYLTFIGEAAGDQFGLQLYNAGDVNGDGISDLIVAAPYNDESANEAGKVYVYSGSTGALIYSFTGEEEDDWFGLMSISAGDLNDDGFSDIVVGSRLNDIGGFNAGRVYVYSGQTGDLLHVLTGEVSEEFGSSVASGGDVNGDGVDDLIVGAWANSANGTYAGRAYVFSGPTMELLHVFTGVDADDWFGNAVACPGDVNGDGVDDILIAAMNRLDGWEGTGWPLPGPPFYWHGVVVLFSGLTYEGIHQYYQGNYWFGEPWDRPHHRFGVSVAAAADIDNDGLGDFLIGADGFEGLGIDVGAAFVKSSGLSGLTSYMGEAGGDHLGLGIASAGDVDGDGYDDFIYGAWGHDAGGLNAGRAYVRSGRTRELLYVFDGGADSDWLGAAVASVGDINGDGFDDFAVGSPGYDQGGTNRGRVDIFLGGWVCGDANGDLVLTADDVEALWDAYFESGDLSCVWRTSDLNCDGWLDLADVMHLVSYIFGTGPPPCCQ